MFDKEKLKAFFHHFHSLDISWQIYSLIILYTIIMLAAFILRWEVGVMLLVLLLAVIVFFVFNYENFIRNLNTMANRLSQNVKVAQEDAMYRSPIGILLYGEEESKRIKWVNPVMQHIFGTQDLLGEPLMSINQDFQKLLELNSDRQWHTVSFMSRYYRVQHQVDVNALYLLDVTEEVTIREQKQFDKVVFGYLFLDDYNEIIETLDDQQVTNFDSILLNDISEWAESYGIFTKRLNEEKFILLLNQNVLNRLEKDKFKFFDDMRERNSLRNMPISISIGIAYPDTEIYRIDDLADQAQLNLDLALGRGGDQIVVRSKTGKARFYGGKTNPTEKRTNIKSRLVYQALRTSIQQAQRILITGHKTPDMDSMGSAIGIYKIVKDFDIPSHIIINEDEFNPDIRQLLTQDQARYLWDSGAFVNQTQAEEFMTDKTLIIMVDHHKPSMSEAEALIEGHDVVIIDHHRRGEEFPEQTVLTYIEPYASSTAELITEFFMNTRNTTEALNKFEATALLAGVLVDTNNFASRTGSRTFDVASYLKSRGADRVQIQRFLKEDLSNLIERNQLLENTKFVKEGYAVIVSPNDKVIDNVTASQTADILLDVKGVEASFVIYRRSENIVGVSARSLGGINVQTIMEKLGGGGHLSNAATQISDTTTEDVFIQLETQLEDE
ncbi:DHH family phosphoesterase [Aerococcaceae bacterium WGS1372]